MKTVSVEELISSTFLSCLEYLRHKNGSMSLDEAFDLLISSPEALEDLVVGTLNSIQTARQEG